MEMYGNVAVVLNQRGWKLETKLTPKVKVDVTKFAAGNGEKYVHINWSGTTLSLHYEEYDELCTIKEALDRQLHILDEPVPKSVPASATVSSSANAIATLESADVPLLEFASSTCAQASTPTSTPTSSATAPLQQPPLQQPSLHVLPVEGIQYAVEAYYPPHINLERGPPPPYQASQQRYHPYSKK